jgi:hypothetical protein
MNSISSQGQAWITRTSRPYMGVTAQLVVPCYPIRHEKQYILWDSAIGDQFAGAKGGTLPFGWALHVPMTLANQFKQLGIRCSDVVYLGFSHEHPYPAAVGPVIGECVNATPIERVELNL